MMPLVVISITRMGDTNDKHELIENSKAEEQRDERQSEKEGEVDDLEKFVLHHQHAFATLGDVNSNYFSKINEYASISRDVLTPPPEFI